MGIKNEVKYSNRIRGTADSPLGELIDWLNTFSRQEAREKVEKALMMAYMPDVKKNSGAGQPEIERCFRETQNISAYHRYYQAQSLGLQWQPEAFANSHTRDNQTNNQHQVEQEVKTSVFSTDVPESDINQESEKSVRDIENRYIDNLFGEDID